MFEDYLESECIASITNIYCLLVFYDFGLSPLFQLSLEINKRFFYQNKNLLDTYIALKDIERLLLEDIWEIYEPYIRDPEKTKHSVWALQPEDGAPNRK